jgi:hypothetical protein
MNDQRHACVVAALRNIAALTTKPADKLSPGQKLVADLGFNTAKIKQLAVWMRQSGNEIRQDGKSTVIRVSELAQSDVADAVSLLIRRTLGVALERDAVVELIECIQENWSWSN